MAELHHIDALRIMMVGPLPPPVGGTTVSFKLLCSHVAEHSGSCLVVDTARRGVGDLRAGLRTLLMVARKLPQADIVTMHFSDRAAITFAPLIWLLCRLAGKPVVYRQFGGQIHQTFANLPRLHRWWLRRTIFRSDAVLLQTKSLIEAFRAHSERIHWFPTAREPTYITYRHQFASRKFPTLRCLYVGHVSRAKGVLTAVHAIDTIPNVELDIFGPLVDVGASELTSQRVHYRGTLPPDQVMSTMANYDILLFPTTYPGEGYAGTLVEAAMTGLPIIASRWQSLPEMFTEEEAFFVEPGSVKDLSRTIRDIMNVPEQLLERSNRLRQRSVDFNSSVIFTRFTELCRSLVDQTRGNSRQKQI